MGPSTLSVVALIVSIWSLVAMILIRAHPFDWRGDVSAAVRGNDKRVVLEFEFSVGENIVLCLFWPLTLPLMLIFRFVFWILRLTRA